MLKAYSYENTLVSNIQGINSMVFRGLAKDLKDFWINPALLCKGCFDGCDDCSNPELQCNICKGSREIYISSEVDGADHSSYEDCECVNSLRNK